MIAGGVNTKFLCKVSTETTLPWGSGGQANNLKHPSKKLHRSDMMIQNQLTVMKNVTSSLMRMVEKLESSNVVDSLIMQKILILERKAQHLKLVLEIVYKINLEIAFWRSKLHQSMISHQSEAELIRQRILWLEHRLERIVTSNTEATLKKFQVPIAMQGKKDELKLTKRIDMLPTSSYIPFKKSVIMKSTVEETSQFDLLDEGEKYWISDHHRFAYTPDVKNILQQNPLSYHSVGLAIPASYVDKREITEDVSLPWMTEQDPAKGNFDIMREDLESLRKKIFLIHDKIYSAAKRSLDTDERFSTPIVKVQSVTPDRQDSSANYYSESTKDSNYLHPYPVERSPSSRTDSQYVTEYVTTGNVLLITRTNIFKKYPHPCDHWSNMRPAEDGIDTQPIIVNQRDLKNKTKLRLFIPKRIKKQQNVERDLITPSSVSSNRSYRKNLPTVKFIENLKSSDGAVLSDIQRNRLNDLMNTLQSSPRVDDRVYAAKSLASLGSTSSEKAIPVLVKSLDDRNAAVRFGAAKALIHLGEWHEKALKEFLSLLKTKDEEVCMDIMNTLACSDHSSSINLFLDQDPQLASLIKILAPFIRLDTDVDDELSFQAAVCVGEICGQFDRQLIDLVRSKLLKVIETTSKWDWHSQALKVLVRRLKFFDEVVLRAIITQLKHALKWKDRLSAALLVAYGGPTKVFPLMQEKEFFDVFYPKLWDDPRRDVRLGVSQAFTSLGLRNVLLENLDVEITNSNPEIRAHAVMVMSAVGIKSDKTLRSLIEMLGLDSSDYVRLQIMRTFHALSITDIRAVRALREREKSGGPLSGEASKILAALDVRLTTGITSVGNGRHNRSSEVKGALYNRSDTGSSWFPSPWRSTRENTTKLSKRHSRHGHTSSSFRSSSDFASSPKYEIISTTGQKFRRSVAEPRAPTAESQISSVSSFF